MFEDQELNPLSSELETAMKSLIPKALAVDPLVIAFEAGCRSELRRTRRWRAATVMVAVISAGLWLWPMERSRHDIATHLPQTPLDHAEVITVIQVPALPPLPEDSLLRLQSTVIEHGVDALPPLHGSVNPDLRIEDSFYFPNFKGIL